MEYPDLFREVALSLRTKGFHQEALRYYEPLQMIQSYVDVPFLFELASCYRAVGLSAQADDCYKTIINIDHGNFEARVGLAKTQRHPQKSQTINEDGGTGSLNQLRNGTRNLGGQAGSTVTTEPLIFKPKALMPAPRTMRQLSKQTAEDNFELQESETHEIFLHRQRMSKRKKDGDRKKTSEWMSATRSLLQAFQSRKVFYPSDKHHLFLGYSKKARLWAAKSKQESDVLQQISETIFGGTH